MGWKHGYLELLLELSVYNPNPSILDPVRPLKSFKKSPLILEKLKNILPKLHKQAKTLPSPDHKNKLHLNCLNNHPSS